MSNNQDFIYRETFKNVGTNAAQLNAGVGIPIEDQVNALKNNNLPHNTFVVANQNATCKVFLFLDDYHDTTKPDYILFPMQQITVSVEEGVTFTTLWIHNSSAADNIAANEIKYRIATIKKIPRP